MDSDGDKLSRLDPDTRWDALYKLLAVNEKKSAQQFADLEKLMNVQIAALEKSVIVALNSSEKAVSKAEFSVEKRFDATNEFRQTLTDQAQTFIPRREVEQALATLNTRIMELSDRQNVASGRDTGTHSSWMVVVSVAGILGGVVMAVIALITLFKNV